MCRKKTIERGNMGAVEILSACKSGMVVNLQDSFRTSSFIQGFEVCRFGLLFKDINPCKAHSCMSVHLSVL